MTIKPDHWIRRMALEQKMIEPFEPAQVRGAVISYGLSSYGYDVRLADEFKVPSDSGGVLDPKAVSRGESEGIVPFVDLQASTIDLAPNTFVLGRIVEYLRLPPNVMALCMARAAMPAVASWLIRLLSSLAGRVRHFVYRNTGPRRSACYAGEGIGQVVFFSERRAVRGDLRRSGGQVPAQQGITPARVG